MQDLPHHYVVSALAAPAGTVTVRAKDLEDIQSSAPPEFGGPEGNWSPETLLVAAVADCFVLTLRAVARASRLEWTEVDCSATGELDKTDSGTRFTRMVVKVELVIPAGGDSARAMRILEKAEHNCLITNSLNCDVSLDASVREA